MKSALYWIAFLIGIIIILYTYQVFTSKMAAEREASKETFAVGIANLSASQATNYYEGPHIPDGVKRLIYMYLSSYSDVMPDNQTPVYVANGSAYWRDLQTGVELFNVIGTNLPTKLRNPPRFGLSMSGVRLIGPPSENVAFPNSGYVLPSISVCFFAKWKTVDLNAPLVLFRMYAETPNHVSVTVNPKDANNVTLSVVCGDFETNYDWVVPKSTLITQGPGALYTFVYDKDANTVTFYVGATALSMKTLQSKIDIKLSNSPIEVNYSQNWDADLQALLICRGIVNPSDITATTDYFLGLGNGKHEEVEKLKQNTEVLSQNLETCSSKLPKLLAEIENLQGEVRYNSTEISNLRRRLEMEKRACANASAGKKEFQWLIKNGTCPKITVASATENAIKLTAAASAVAAPSGSGKANEQPPISTSFKYTIPTVGTSVAQTAEIILTKPKKETDSPPNTDTTKENKSWLSWFGLD